MKTISEALREHLAQEVTTLAMCWKLTRRDGVVLGFTDHDRDVLYDEVTYRARAAFQGSAITATLGLSADNFDLEGILSDDAITEADILAGRYDYAEITCFMVNYANVSQGILPLKTGWLGEVTLQGQQFTAEIRGISDALQRTIGETYSPTCRASLGDARCQKNLASFTVTGSVTSTDSLFSFTDTARSEVDDYFSYGVVTFTSGANAGIAREIKRYAQDSFTSFQPWPFSLAVGDAYQAIAGCDKRFETCISKFSNALNFRGEPDVPGTDAMLETSATRRSE